MTIRSFILAGGTGSRLWPASQPTRPKQFLSLGAGRSLIAETLARVAPLSPGVSPVIVSVEEHDALVREALPEHDAEHVWLEPQGRNTGPSVAWVLHELSRDEPDAVAVLFPADHHVGDPDALREAVHRAAEVAAVDGRIALLGATPERPETGYGYIEAGPEIADGVRTVARFREKPDSETARDLYRRPEMTWNCGIFVIPVRGGLRRIKSSSPELAALLGVLPEPGTARRPDGPLRSALAAAFREVPAVPFDKAVLERTDDSLVVSLDAGWSDLGSWQAVWETGRPDANGNVAAEGSVMMDSDRCLVFSDGARIAALGVQDLVVVAWGNTVLVCPRDRAQDIRRIALVAEAAAGKGESE